MNSAGSLSQARTGHFPSGSMNPGDPVMYHIAGFSLSSVPRGTCLPWVAPLRCRFLPSQVSAMRKSPLRLVVAVVAAGLVLAACHNESPQQKLADQSAKPAAAVQNTIPPLKGGDFDSLLQHLLPPADYRQLRSDWKGRERESLAKVSDADRRRFAKEMAALTAPGAKQKQLAKLEPVLDAWDTKYKQRVPMIVGIARIMVGTRITQSDSMTGKQKIEARGVLDALATWAQDTDWGDKAKAKQAVGVVVDTARALKLKTLDQAYQLDFEQAMQRYGTAWMGLKELLSVYGLSVDSVLDSMKVKPLKQNGDSATVQVDYTILGKPMTSTLEMVRKGKRWYPRDFLKHWRKSRARLARGASTARAASTAVAPATSTAPARPRSSM